MADPSSRPDFAGEAGRALRPLLSPRGWIGLLPWWALTLGVSAAGLTLTHRWGLTGLPWRVGVLALAAALPAARSALQGVRQLAPMPWLLATAVQAAVSLGWGLPLALGWSVVGVSVSGSWLQRGTWPSLMALILGASGGFLLWLGSLVMITGTAAGASPIQLAHRLWQRRWDLVWLGASGIAGAAVACTLALPLGLGVAWMVGGLAPRVGVWVSLVAYSMPLGLGLLMAARGAGHLAALTVAETHAAPAPAQPARATPAPPEHRPFPPGPRAWGPRAEVRSASTSAAAALSQPTIRPMAAATPLPGAPQGMAAEALAFVQAIGALSLRGEHDLPGAIAQAERMAAESPRSAGVFAELAKLYLKDGRAQLALDTAARAIDLALNGGMSPVAVNTLVAFWEQRNQLELEPSLWRQLARVLAAQQQGEAAAWCERRSLPPPQTALTAEHRSD